MNTEVLLTSELKPERLNKENIARILIWYVYVKNTFCPSQTDTKFGRNRAVNATVWMYIKGIGIAAVLCPLQLCIGESWDGGGGSLGMSAPSRSNFFHFHVSFQQKFYQIIKHSSRMRTRDPPGQRPPPWTEIPLDSCKNITLSQTSFAGGNNRFLVQILGLASPFEKCWICHCCVYVQGWRNIHPKDGCLGLWDTGLRNQMTESQNITVKADISHYFYCGSLCRGE